MFEKLKKVGLVMPTRSLLQTAGAIMEVKGALPGSFSIHVKRSRRNSTEGKIDTDILNKIKACCRARESPPPSVIVGVRLEAGIKLNGRPVGRGDLCVYTKSVNRYRLVAMDTASARETCTVLALYQVICGDVEELFAEVIAIKTHSRHRSLFILHKDDLALTGFPSIIIHVDAIVLKLHVSPHWDNDTLVCAVPMWETR